MTTDTTCNGWTNYATWRVNLELVDGNEPALFCQTGADTPEHILADNIQCYCEDYIDETSHGLARDYALAFLAQVNWREIARNLISAYKEFA